MATMLKQLTAQNLTSAGTAQRVSSTSILCQYVKITALSANTGATYVGNSAVSSANSAPIAAGSSVEFFAPAAPGGGADDIDLKELYWDSATTGNDIYVTYMQRTN